MIFTNSNWAGSITDRRSPTGYCTYVWGNLVTWRSKKQPVVSRNNAEAEFRVMALRICEGMWLRKLLADLRFPNEGHLRLLCDNQAAINIAKDPIHLDRTKHIKIDHHFIKEKIEADIISINYTPTKNQIADILTKALPRANFEDLSSTLGMINIYYQA